MYINRLFDKWFNICMHEEKPQKRTKTSNLQMNFFKQTRCLNKSLVLKWFYGLEQIFFLISQLIWTSFSSLLFPFIPFVCRPVSFVCRPEHLCVALHLWLNGIRRHSLLSNNTKKFQLIELHIHKGGHRGEARGQPPSPWRIPPLRFWG